MKSIITTFILLVIITIHIQAQDLIPGEWVVQFESEEKAQQFAKESGADAIKSISPTQVVYLLKYELTKSVDAKTFYSSKDVVFYNQNMKVEKRAIPNDPLYTDQWNLPRIGIDKVWDVTTGGTVVQGTDIVVAIADEGFDISHKDLQNNVWINKGEIPDNGIDDDGNGYIDDYKGANVATGNGDHWVEAHGSSVMGVIGGDSNNDEGISGINWNVKMMLVSGISNVADIIESYEYIKYQRKLFNDTDGDQGAFVVVSNLSLGVDNVFDTDWPIWCRQYEDLGNLGVLNVGSTTNSVINIDAGGDLPTYCSSDHLLIVTNSDKFDALEGGYSSTRVDIAAPGDVIAPSTEDRYDFSFFGTSASCPHVVGSIALLYSLDCSELYDLAISNPSSISLLLKNAILDNADPAMNFAGRTVTGGILNTFETLNSLSGVCGEVSVGDLAVEITGEHPNERGEISINYQTNIFEEHDVSIFNAAGMLISRFSFKPEAFGSRELTFTRSQISNGIPLSAGVYMLMLENSQGRVSTKFVVAK